MNIQESATANTAQMISHYKSYTKKELSKMFGVRSTVLPALELIMTDPDEYHRRREAAIKLGLVGC